MATAAPSSSHPATGVHVALPSDPAPMAVARPSAAASLACLATVELQLVMQFCDLQSLLFLARCSHSALEDASDPLAWRGRCLALAFVHPPAPGADAGQRRPEISLWQRLRCCIRPPPPPPPAPSLLLPSLTQRISGSLLRHCDIRINWNYDRSFRCYPVSDAEQDALAAIPRLRVLDSCDRQGAGPSQIAALVQRPGLRGLVSLVCGKRQLHEKSIGALAVHCPQLSTVSTQGSSRTDPPLHRLPALTDLTVGVRHSGGLTMAGVARCAGLRRLSVWPDNSNGFTARDVHAALLSPTLRSLEYLAVHGLDALHADGRNQPAARLEWAAAFAHLPALRSLRLTDPRGIDELLAAIGAGCPQLHSLNIGSDQVDVDDPTGIGAALPSAAALSSLLARLPSLRSVVLFLPTRERCTGARWPVDYRAREDIWLHAHGELTALAALHHQRLRVTFRSNFVF